MHALLIVYVNDLVCTDINLAVNHAADDVDVFQRSTRTLRRGRNVSMQALGLPLAEAAFAAAVQPSLAARLPRYAGKFDKPCLGPV